MRLAIMAVLILATLANAATYYVDPNGNDAASGTATAPFKTIQHGGDIAKPGDTILINAGDYAGASWYGKRGTVDAPIVFKANGAANIVSKSTKQTALSVGLEFTGTDTTNGSAFIVVDGININNKSGTINGSLSSGVRGRFSKSLTFRNVTASDCGFVGMYFAYVDGVLIESGEAARNNGFVDSGTARNHGIYFAQGSTNCTIRGVKIHDNNGNGIHCNGDGGLNTGFLIERNQIWNNGTIGGSAINCDGLASSTIQNNLLNGNKSKGVALYSINGGAPSNNIIVNNTIDNSSSTREALQIKGGSKGNRVINTIAIGTQDIQDVVAFSNNIFAATIPSNLFAAAGDYHLKTGSPAIDAGTTTSAPIVDLEGKVRDAKPDVGAYEFGQGGGDGGTTQPTTEPTTVPTSIPAPTNLVGDRRVVLTWKDNATTEAAYYVEHSTDGGANWERVKIGVDRTSYTWKSLTTGAHIFRVGAVDANGGVAYSPTWSIKID